MKPRDKRNYDALNYIWVENLKFSRNIENI